MVDAVTMLDELMPLNMIGIKKVQGGSLEESLLVPGVAFKKTFSYAGFEMQQKSYKNPRIALLNIELELKAEKDNAEVRVDNVEEVLCLASQRCFSQTVTPPLSAAAVPKDCRRRVGHPLRQAGAHSQVRRQGGPVEAPHRRRCHAGKDWR